MERAVEDVFRFADAFGPARIVHIHRPHAGLKAIAVIDKRPVALPWAACAWRRMFRWRNAFVSPAQ